ncbi:MAG: hypothetical protein ACK55Z_01635, partial [bacterium]
EYTKQVTTTISLGNTPASGGEDKALLTASETRTAQALDAIPVVPVKRTGEDADYRPPKRQGGHDIAHGN